MRISILEPKGPIWEGIANQVILPAEEGQMCVLDFHQPFVARLNRGNIAFSDIKIAVKDGIAYMRSNTLTVFAQT
jgi:F0F1-type ATP synthase epsilon subunit